jgi:tyrosine-protein kinase Etk/Wzc
MTPNVSIPSPQPLLRSGENAHIYDYLAVILRRKVAFALAFLAVFLGVALYTFLMKPIYEAYGTLHIKRERGQGSLFTGMTFDSSSSIDAELEIIKSRTNAEHVVKRLHLDWQVTKKAEGLAFKLLDFSSTSKNPSYQIEITGADTFTVKDDNDNLVGRGKAGELMQGKGVTLFLTDLRARAGDGFRLKLLPLQNLAVGLKGGFKATEVGNRTGIIRISYSSTDPVQARDLVNTLVQIYLEQAIVLKTEEASRTVSFIEDQLKGLRGELEGAEQNLETYKSSSGMFKLDSEAQEVVKKLSDTEKSGAESFLLRKQMEFARDALKESLRRGSVYSPGIMRNDPLVASLAAKLSELDVQKRTLLADYTEAHPAVKALQVQINEVQKKILVTYEMGLAGLAKQQETLAQQLALDESKLRKLPKAERDLARLTRVSNVNAGIYTFLLQKHEEARLARAATVSNIQIVDSAITPGAPLKPDKPKNLLLGFLVGCLLGVGLAFFLEYLDDTIKDADEAKRVMGLPLLAVIPHIPGIEPKANIPQKMTLITRLNPKSVVSEAFRALRTSLHFSAINREKKIMLVTSAFPQEGKSTISSNLASILSQTGAHVLIVDCDLRRSSLHEEFGHSKTPGLSEILTGDVTFAEAIHNTGIPGLDLISSGTNPPNPSELLGSEPMRRFLLTQRENYDHIVIDAPPVLAVSDAPVLTAISDLVVLVMEAGRVPIKVARHMREILSTLQAPVAGLVINDKTGKGESYSYYGDRHYRYGKGKRYGDGYGYGYGYGHYYSDDERTKPQKKIAFWGKIPFWKKFFPSREK